MSESSPATAMVGAVRRILRPLVRHLIRHGVTFPAVSGLLKRVFVEVAEEEGKLPRRKLSDSRIALITGIPRKEVARLREEDEPAKAVPLDAHFATRLLGRWTADPAFLTPDGEPQILPFEQIDDGPSFSDLVKQVGQDIPARAVLDELVRVGAVAVSRARDVSLLTRRYVPSGGTVEKIDMLGTDVAELVATIGHNIVAPRDDAFLQQKIEFDNVGSRGVPILRRRLRELGDAFLNKVEQLMVLYDRDRNPSAPGGARTRVVMGAYYFQEETPAPERPKEGDGDE